MRAAAFVFIAIQIAFVLGLIIMAATTRSDSAGEGMAIAYAVIGCAIFAVLPLPALLVAAFTAQHWLALTLSALGMVAFVIPMVLLA